MERQAVGIDIGGTKCAVMLGEEKEGSIYITEKIRMETDQKEAPESIIERFKEAIDRFLRQGAAPSAIGISCGGPLDSLSGRIQRPPNLPLWDDVPITSILSERFQIPVFLQNDANACALAEWKYGAGRGSKNMIFLTFGTGLGAGLILDGRLYSGTTDMAGEAGHIRICEQGPVGYGKCGSFEGFCSGGGIAQLGYTLGLAAYQRGECPLYFDPEKAPEGISAKTIAQAADKGDVTAREVYRLCGEKLGYGLSILIDILNPERIVIGSIFARSKELIWPATEAVIKKEVLPRSSGCCEVVAAQLGEQLGDFAAVSTALYQMEGVAGR